MAHGVGIEVVSICVSLFFVQFASKQVEVNGIKPTDDSTETEEHSISKRLFEEDWSTDKEFESEGSEMF